MELPESLRFQMRYQWPMWAVTGAYVAVACIAAAVGPKSELGRWFFERMWTFPLVLLTGAAASIPTWHILVRRVRAARYRLCTRCVYPLPEDERDGVCPECGRTWLIETTELVWRDRLGG